MTERRRRGPKRTRSVVADQPPYAQPRRRLPVTPLVTDDELDAIHRASLRVLAETGIDFLHPEARRLLAAAGARVDGDRVRFDP
ncbi:MAG: trimethylamine methyltransferase family protein, partial [Ilumatobacter sp.]